MASPGLVDEFSSNDDMSTTEERSTDADFATDVVVRGHRLHVVVRGQGRPLLLIGGIGANVAMCEPFARELTQTRLIMFDMPGCGRSSTPARPIGMAGLASIVEGLLDELCYERVDVLGVSMGGGLAQQLARQAPERVRRLVLVATGCGAGMVPGRPWALGVMTTPLRYYSTPFFKLVAPIFLGGEKWRDRSFVHEHAAARRARPPSLARVLHPGAERADVLEPSLAAHPPAPDPRTQRRRRSNRPCHQRGGACPSHPERPPPCDSEAAATCSSSTAPTRSRL